MTEIAISKSAFALPRTPANLKHYAQEVYKCIDEHKEMKNLARLRKEPYKTFLEELLPFTHFCEWKYDGRDDVLCSLVEGTPGRDGIVKVGTTGQAHSVEITWPIDGEYVVEKGRQLNERGCTSLDIWDWEDVSLQKSAVRRTLKIAQKKALRDYRCPGGSTMIFVFDHWLFWDSNPQHVAILNCLRAKLTNVNLQVDTVLLMLVFADQKRIVQLRSTEHNG